MNAAADVRAAAVLAVLRQAAAPLPIDRIAAALGLPQSTARFHLDRLVQRGLVSTEKEERTVPGRRRLLYRALPPEAVEDAAAYRSLARMLAEALVRASAGEPRAAAEEVGRRWARSIPAPRRPAEDGTDAVRTLAGVLRDVGFGPEVVDDDPSRATVLLHRCPFRDVARAQPAVVCGMHLGFLRQTLRDTRRAVTVRELRPVPDGSAPCVAELDIGR